MPQFSNRKKKKETEQRADGHAEKEEQAASFKLNYINNHINM